MSSVSVYIDTRIVLSLLGINGKEQCNSAHELIELCGNTSARVGVFSHTLEEVQGIFQAVADRIKNDMLPDHEVGTWATLRGMTVSDTLEFSSSVHQRIQKSIEKKGSQRLFFVDDTPTTPNDLRVNESRLFKRLRDDLRQKNVGATSYDLKSLTSIFTLRNGKGFRKLERCKAIFVSSNRGLARTSTLFFQEEFKENGDTNSVQLCMAEHVFATRLWVKTPTSFSTKPKKQVLAHIASCLRANPRLKENFVRKVGDLRQSGALSDYDAGLSLLSGLTQQALASSFSYYQTEISDEETLRAVQAVIERARSSANDSDEEMDSLKADLESAKIRLNGMSKEFISEKDQLAREVERLANEAAREIEKRRKTEAAVKKLSMITSSVVVLVLVTFAVWVLLNSSDLSPEWVAAASLAIGAIALIGSLLSGFTSLIARKFVEKLTS